MTTLERIQAKLKQLQQEADVLIARKAQAAVDQIRDLMLKHGLTTADIEAKAKARRDAESKAKTSGKLPPKYMNPKTGETWSGHARPPVWIKDVKDRTKFLIDGAGISSAKPKRVAAKENLKRAPLPAKYRDPKTGLTWSGRGPAPAWLASAKDRTKFLIVPSHAPDSRDATRSKATANGSVAGKNAGARKSATSRRAAAKKSSATPIGKKGLVTSAKTRKVPSRKASAQVSADATPA